MQIAFFVTVFIWAKASSLSGVSQAASEAFPRFISTVSSEFLPFSTQHTEAASDAAHAPAPVSFLELSAGVQVARRASAWTAAAPAAPEAALADLLPSSVTLSNPLLGVLSYLVGGGGGGSSSGASGALSSEAMQAASSELAARGSAARQLPRFAVRSVDMLGEEAEEAVEDALSASSGVGVGAGAGSDVAHLSPAEVLSALRQGEPLPAHADHRSVVGEGLWSAGSGAPRAGMHARAVAAAEANRALAGVRAGSSRWIDVESHIKVQHAVVDTGVSQAGAADTAVATSLGGQAAGALATAGSAVARAVTWLRSSLLGGAGAEGGLVITFPHHVETVGLVLEVWLALMTTICLVLTHVTPPGGWRDVAGRIACGEVRQVGECFREWKLSSGAVASPAGSPGGSPGAAPLPSPGGGVYATGSELSKGAASGADRQQSEGEQALASLQALSAAGAESRRADGAAAAGSSSKGGASQSGLPPASVDVDPRMLRVCGKCEWPAGSGWRAPKPDRCHHCRHCGECVLEMDHHCPWVANCVGAGNRKYFVLLLLYASLSLAVFLAWMAPNFVQALQSVADLRRQFVYLFAYFLAALLWLLLTGFFLFHVYLLTAGLTTIEWCEKSSHARKAAASAAAAGPSQGSGKRSPAQPASRWQPPAGLHLEEYTSGGQVSKRQIDGQPGNGGSFDGSGFGPGAGGAFDPLGDGPVDLLALSDSDFATLPEQRFVPLLRAQLYAASPFDVGAARNFAAVLGGNLFFWLLPVSWGVPERPPYAVSLRFAEFRRRVCVRDAWRLANRGTVLALEAAWDRLHGKARPASPQTSSAAAPVVSVSAKTDAPMAGSPAGPASVVTAAAARGRGSGSAGVGPGSVLLIGPSPAGVGPQQSQQQPTLAIKAPFGAESRAAAHATSTAAWNSESTSVTCDSVRSILVTADTARAGPAQPDDTAAAAAVQQPAPRLQKLAWSEGSESVVDLSLRVEDGSGSSSDSAAHAAVGEGRRSRRQSGVPVLQRDAAGAARMADDPTLQPPSARASAGRSRSTTANVMEGGVLPSGETTLPLDAKTVVVAGMLALDAAIAAAAQSEAQLPGMLPPVEQAVQ